MMDFINFEVPIGISNRHVHLSLADLEKLFGKGYKLTETKELQPGQFACEETVTVIGPRGIIENVRILSPIRKITQIEISRTDTFKLGIKAPIKDSGDLEDTPGCILIGPKGVSQLEKGVIIAARHIHMPPKIANRYGLTDNDKVNVDVNGDRELVFKNVLVRVHPSFALEMHIDTDEANAAFLASGDKVKAVIYEKKIKYLVG